MDTHPTPSGDEVLNAPRYAAYGSNLQCDDLARWCAETGHTMPLCDAAVPAWLPDRRPAFTAFGARRNGGVLDIVPTLGAITPCALFEVDESALRALDAKESRGTLYRRIATVALTADLEAHPAVSYEVVADRRSDLVPPHEDYVDVVRRGLIRHGHDDAALGEAARGAPGAGTLNRLFLYGTLMEGECRHHVLREHGLVAIEPATVAGRLIELGSYPGLLPPKRREERASGVLATVEDIAGLLRRLDRIEGFRGWHDPRPLFARRLVMATTPGMPGMTSIAWTYRYASPTIGTEPTRTGLWRSR